MKETMYDKLGDLLNESLEKGYVPYVKTKLGKEGKPDCEPLDNEDFSRGENESLFNDCAENDFEKRRAEENRRFGEEFFADRKKSSAGKSQKVIYKKLSPEVERAFKLLDIGFSASLDDAKKAYKDKLKYYHPDKFDGNAVLKKVATDKTRQVVEAYKIATDFISS